jgi:3-carboxy-cis,cis-muconate cycloisomerase
MAVTLLTPIFSDELITQQFSDELFIAYMLQFELALARVQARLGIIPAAAASQIEKTLNTFQADIPALRNDMDKSGIPTIALIQQLRTAIGAEYSSYVHWGATSQDVMDTALVLQLRECLTYLEKQLQHVIQHFGQMAHNHRHTLMAGRSHSQQALPITFGFKVANWIAPLSRHQQRLQEIKPRLLVLQFGGAVGTLASLGEQGLKVQEALARELDLELLPIAWHNQRDGLAELASNLSLITGSLAKMAQDVILLAPSEVAEVRESDDPSRGGSSTMPQKRNPIISEAIIAAARQNANLLASMHHALIHEHERATGSWQLEWLTLPQMLQLTASALKQALFLSQNLVIDVAQMQANVAASQGLMLAEAVDLALAPIIGRTEAKRIIKVAVPIALAEKRHLVDVVREQVQADIDWNALRDESNYLGCADAFIDRVLDAVNNINL